MGCFVFWESYAEAKMANSTLRIAEIGFQTSIFSVLPDAKVYRFARGWDARAPWREFRPSETSVNTHTPLELARPGGVCARGHAGVWLSRSPKP